MDWDLAIKRNREALLAIVAQMMALAGIGHDDSSKSFSKPIHRAILLIIRPAEAAVRRLIIIAARNLSIPDTPPISARVDFSSFAGSSDISCPRFRLIDPRKDFRSSSKTEGPKSMPRFSIPGLINPDFSQPMQSNTQDVNADALVRRLRALEAAINDLPRQARRLVRYETSRQNQAANKPIKLPVLRPGFPPGHRKRKIYEVDHVLMECDLLVRDYLRDTKARSPTPVAGQY